MQFNDTTVMNKTVTHQCVQGSEDNEFQKWVHHDVVI